MPVGPMPTAQKSIIMRGTGILPVFVRQMNLLSNFYAIIVLPHAHGRDVRATHLCCRHPAYSHFFPFVFCVFSVSTQGLNFVVNWMQLS
jgi:hypothetical protein